MSAHQFDRSLGPRAKLLICFDYSAGSPGCHTMRNGDPGWPPEPEYIEVTDVQVWNRASDNGPWVNCYVSIGEDAIPNDTVEGWCQEFIDQQREAEMAARDESDRHRRVVLGGSE